MRGAQFGFRLNAEPRKQLTLWSDGFEVTGDTTGGEELPSSSFPDGSIVVTERGQSRWFATRPPRSSGASAAGDGAILAPMPGKVTSVEVAAGDAVTKGQRLLTLEAMKMEHGLVAPFDGVVAELNTHEGAQVQVDAVLARVEKAETP